MTQDTIPSSSPCFSDNPIMIGYNSKLFVADDRKGFRFPGNVFVGSSSFETFEQVTARIRRNSGYPVILNVGDSSTSGWNSERISHASPDPHEALFTYPTYSDALCSHTPNVINAGVPGYSSLQGRLYLSELLYRLRRQDISVNYVSIYFGNNDCTFNGLEDKVRLELRNPSTESNGSRTSIPDFSCNMSEIIRLAIDYGAHPIVIIPCRRFCWEPGIRSIYHRDESLRTVADIQDVRLRNSLRKASAHYANRRFKEALESDFTLPRIKSDYIKAIYAIVPKDVPIIDLQRDITPKNEAELFVDYCHPGTLLCAKIADKIHRFHLHTVCKKRGGWYSFSFKETLRQISSDESPKDVYTIF